MPDATLVPIFAVHATGVRIYACTAMTPDAGVSDASAGDAGAGDAGVSVNYAWVFTAPEATLFGRARFIHRVNTAGGVAPTTGCDAANVGATRRVNYTADYYFWGSR